MLTLGSFNGLTSIRHAYFTRNGGVSTGIYQSLNCGFGSHDDPRNVAENRRRAMALIDQPPEALVTAYQTHSSDVTVVDTPWEPGQAPKADAMVTDRPGIALGVLTADCAPILLADPKAGIIGAAHAGWRGALDGIVEATVAAMEEKGAKRRDIMAGIGPCIGRRSYEVGPDFPEPFLEDDPTAKDFFTPGGNGNAAREGRFLFDLAGYAARRLARLRLDDVKALPCDTLSEVDRFFSHRRATLAGEPDYARGLSAIVLEP